jgi:hypothetical protein
MSLAVLADHMASKGRGPDSMLIHMSPREVQGLQSLAMAHGGSLTVNPETGLPEAGILDKLLPTIIGAGLSFIPGVGPLMAAGIVGGIQTVRTGDIGKGLAAGLGAYGGAGLAQGLATAGAANIGGEAAGQSYLSSAPGVLEGAGAGLSADMAFNLADSGVSSVGADAARQAAAERIAAASPFEKMSAGFNSATSSPQAAGAFLKDNAKNLMYAAGPAILAGANVQSKGPQTITKPGMIRPYSFDPYGGTYTAGTPYEAMPTKAANGGLMGMDDGGYSPGQLDFTQRSEPVVRMASGGVVALAGGGDYTTLTKDSSAEDIASAYKQFTTASGGDTAANQKAAVDYLTNLGIGQDKIGQAYGTYQASPTYNQYTNEQIGSYLTTNPNVDLATAISTTNANPADVNRYISNIAAPFIGSTETTGGSGTLGIYNQMNALGIDPNELYAARIAADPKYAGWSQADIARGYALDKGALALAAADKDGVTDKEWAKFMDDNKYSVNDMAQAFGLSISEVQRRYDAAKKEEKKPITCPVGYQLNAAGTACVPIGVTEVFNPPIIPGVNDYGLGGTGTSGRLEGVYGPALPPGVSGAGITTVNPNGTITTRPNIPGIPEGGFTGMTSLRDAYTKGGGSLGYIPYAPKTIEEFNQKYGSKLTGGSKQSYDYLTGKTPYDPTPYTKTGEIQKPYWESVGRFPENRKAKKYVFVNGKYELNPDYVKPSYVLAGEKAAADKAAADKATGDKATGTTDLTNQDEKPTSDPGSGNEWIWDYASKKWIASPIQVAAAGGLMAMARGGMTQQFDLGGYSDGGRLLRGPGDGVSDSIPATIGNKRPARLADGEFVVPARIVSELGNGSTEAGARKLYAMMDRVQKARRGTVGKGKVAKNSRSEKYLPA